MVIHLKQIDYSNIKKDHFTVQGYVIIEDEIWISAYHSKKRRKKDQSELYNSRIYVYKKTGELKTYYILRNHAHVGGITYDKENKIVFITSYYGKIDAYDYEKLKTIDNHIIKKNVRMTCPININDGLKKRKFSPYRAATITMYQNNLYIATFEKKGKLVKVIYKRKEDKIEVEEISLVTEIGGAVQGIFLYQKNNICYLVESSSCSNIKTSGIRITDMTNQKFIASININRRGLEGIYVDKEECLTGIFEFDQQIIGRYQIKDIIKEYQNAKQNILETSIKDFYKKYDTSIYEKRAGIDRKILYIKDLVKYKKM